MQSSDTPNEDTLRKGILMIASVTGHPPFDWVCNDWFDTAREADKEYRRMMRQE